MKQQILNIGPALVDLVAHLPSADTRYARSLEFLNAAPGMYIPLETQQQASELLGILLSNDVPIFDNFAETIRGISGFDLIAGSTGLGFLAALPKEQRKHSTIITTVGSDGKVPSPIASIYTEDTDKLGIKHHTILKAGAHPLGITISSADNPEKILTMHSGVAFELDTIEDETPDIIHIDAYELIEGPIAGLIHDLIMLGKYRISLGLGNESILDERMVQRILQYVDLEKLDFVCGNKDEWNQIMGTSLADIRDFEGNQLGNRIPHILITDGPNGIAAVSDSRFLYQAAQPQTQIINTAGSGDTAAGVFVSGLLDSKPLEQILREAVHWAGYVASIEHTKLPNGRES